jgi:hypothetical protein
VLIGVVKRSRISVVAAIVAAVATLGGAADALACSCAPAGRDAIRASDAAVVAKLIEVVPDRDNAGEGAASPSPAYREAEFRYRIKRVFKGRHRLERGDRLTISSTTSGAACGLPTQERRMYGLLLSRNRSAQRWQANLCTVTTPRQLRELARDREEARSSAGAGAGCKA